MDFAEVQIYTPGHLLAEFLQGSLEDQRRGLEARYTQPALMEAGQVTTIGLRLEQIEVCCGNERPTATIAKHRSPDTTKGQPLSCPF